jgi:hypothetical protein
MQSNWFFDGSEMVTIKNKSPENTFAFSTENMKNLKIYQMFRTTKSAQTKHIRDVLDKF